MNMLRAATPGTFLVLAGTVFLVIVTVSAPIWNKVYFLSADFSGSGSAEDQDISVAGAVVFGTFGYCFEDGSSCPSPSLGYEFDANSLSGVSSDLIDLPEGLIKWLTYVLVLHPIAAAFGAISLCLGILAHLKELSTGCGLAASWVAGIASTLSIIAFAFDMALFTIAKSRINDSAQSSGDVEVDTAADYGNAIWLTLAAFLCFAVSGCCFRYGRRVVRGREADRAAANAFKPEVNDSYASDARDAAKRDEMSRIGYGQAGDERGLPSFAERENAPSDMESAYETVPLTNWQEQGCQGQPNRYGNASAVSGSDRDQLPGVGTGYGKRQNAYNDRSEYAYNGTGYNQAQGPPESTPMLYSPTQALGPSVQSRLMAEQRGAEDYGAARAASGTFADAKTPPIGGRSQDGAALMYTPGTQQDPYTHAITAPSQGYSQPESLTQDNSQYDQTYGIAYRPGQDETYDAQHGPSRDQDFYKSEHQHQTAGGSAYDQDQPYTQPTSYPTQDPQQQYTSYPTQDSQQQQSSSYQDYQQPMAISSSSDYYAVAAGHPPSYKTNQTTGAGHGAAALRDEKPRQYW